MKRAKKVVYATPPRCQNAQSQERGNHQFTTSYSVSD